nr:hypothetical protein [Nonomuraea sp. FMUSA5-5]
MKVLIQPLETTHLTRLRHCCFPPFRSRLEQQFDPATSKFPVAQLIVGEQVDVAVAGDGLGQHLLIGGLDQLVDQLGRQDVLDLEPGRRRLGAQRDQQVRLARPRIAD